MSAEKSGSTINVVSQDGEIYTISRSAARMSTALRMLLEDAGDKAGEGIPLPEIEAPIVRKVITYCEHHTREGAEEEEEEEESSSRDPLFISEWDKGFGRVPQETLFKLILAANYLDIAPMLDMLCKTVAALIRGKTPEEIRVTFNLPPKEPEDDQELGAAMEDSE